MPDPTEYQTADELRAAVSPTLDDTTKFPDATLDEVIAEFEDLAERYRGVAFIPRTQVDTIYTRDPTSFIVVRPELRSVTSLTIGGDAVTVGDLDLDKPPGIIRYWFPANSTLVVTYSHGLDDAPSALVRACRQYVRSSLLSDTSTVGRDVIAQSVEGHFTRYSTPDWDAGRPTGYLDVDRLLNTLTDYRGPGIA